MVQEVEGFSSELDVYSFRDVCPLHDRQIVVCLEWPTEDVASEVTKCSVPSVRRYGIAVFIKVARDNHILIVNAPATRYERTEIYKIIDSIGGATGCQDRACPYRSAAAVDEIRVLQRKRAKVCNQEWST